MNRLLIAPLLLLLSPLVIAEDLDAAAAKLWIEKMTMAAKELNYVGDFLYQQHGSSKFETINIVHYLDESGEYEQLTSLNGNSWKLIRKDDQIFCPFPGEPKRGLRHNKLSNLSALNPIHNFDALVKSYRFRIEKKKERVANRLCRIIAIVPQDKFRYGYRLWIDDKTGLLMRSEVINDDAKVVEQMMFTRVSFANNPMPIDIPEGAHSISRGKAPIIKPVPVGPKQLNWSVDLPPGFFLAEYNGGGKKQEHIVYTDGIAFISVFIEKIKDQKIVNNQHMANSVSQGALNAMALTNNESGRQITVVGEVPKNTLHKIATTFRFNQP